jgi:hypothetical protein
MTRKEVQSLCPEVGFTADALTALCPRPIVGLPFATGQVQLEFSAYRLTQASAVPSSWELALEVLTAKYGPPDVLQTTRGGKWVIVDKLPSSGPRTLLWDLDGGNIVLGTPDGKEWGVDYTSKAHLAAQEANY